MEIRPQDIIVDRFVPTGPDRMAIVQITHLPTGLVERAQHFVARHARRKCLERLVERLTAMGVEG